MLGVFYAAAAFVAAYPSGMLMYAGLLVGFVFPLFVGLPWSLCRTSDRLTAYLHALSALLLAGAISTVVVSNWPLSIVFALHRPAFDALLQSGSTTPTRIGFYWVTPEQHHSGCRAFIVMYDRTGYGRFVHSDEGDPTGSFNPWYSQPLGNGWYYVDED